MQLLPGRSEGRATLRITIREGRNRQVRKMLEAIGHPVDHLTRVAIGPIARQPAEAGALARPDGAEVAALKERRS